MKSLLLITSVAASCSLAGSKRLERLNVSVHRLQIQQFQCRLWYAQVVPRVCVIGGKAAPGYEMAKRIIKLVSSMTCAGLLKTVWILTETVPSAYLSSPRSNGALWT